MSPLPLPQLTLVQSRRPSTEREALEQAVRGVYASAYGARIEHFLPILLGMRDATGALLGVIGAQLGADEGPMFLESYLDEPVERVLSRAARAPTTRAVLAEVGNLSAVQPGAGMLLVSTLAAYLEGAGVAWALFTATDVLRLVFVRRGLELTDLGDADGRRLGVRLADWGRYYATNPRVTAVDIASLRATLMRDERLVARCAAPWDEAFRAGRLHARGAA